MENKTRELRKLFLNGADVTGHENDGQATTRERSPEPSAAATSTGIRNSGCLRAEKMLTVVISGENNTYNNNSLQPTFSQRPARIEFNIQECVQAFTGRDEFIKTLHKNICPTQVACSNTVRSQFIVICGMAGAGKTQLVRKYIKEYKNFYDHVMWINAERKSEAVSCFIRLAKKLRIHINHDGNQMVEEDICNLVFDFVCEKSTLIVYDNVGSYKDEDGKDGILTLLPQTVKIGWKVPSIIVTTRNRNWPDFVIKELMGFELNESLAFLSTLESTPSEDHQKLCEDVANICQGLPLALQQVVTYIRYKKRIREALHEGPYTLKEFLTEVDSNRGTLILSASDSGDQDVYTIFALTFKDISSMKYGKLALQCLDIMAILNPDFIPTEIIKAIFSEAKPGLADALILLNMYNLITRCDNFYQMHRIVQAAKITWNSSNSNWAYVKHNIRKIVKSVTEFLNELPIKSENILEILNNVIRLSDQAPETNSDRILDFKTKLVHKLQEAGSYRAAVKHLENVLEARSKKSDRKQQETILIQHNLTLVYDTHGKQYDAHELYKDILQLHIRFLGPDHPSTLLTRDNLALVAANQGRYFLQEEIYSEVLQMHDKLLDQYHQAKLPTNCSVTNFFKNRRRYRNAEKMYTLLSKQYEASYFASRGYHTKALDLYEEVFEMRSQLQGEDHPSTLLTKHNLALVFRNLGNYKEAVDLYYAVRDVQIKILGKAHPDTLMTQLCLADAHQNYGKYSDAKYLLEKVLEIQIKRRRPRYQDILLTKHNIANALRNQGKYDEAQKLYQEVVSRKIEELGVDHSSTLLTKHNLATVFRKQGNYNEAQYLLEEVLQSQIKKLVPHHPATLRTKYNLAVVFRNQAKYNDSQELLTDVLEKQITHLGSDHPETLRTHYNLANVYQNVGKYTEAENIYNKVLEIQTKILGPSHPERLCTKHNIAVIFKSQGRFNDAQVLYNEVLQMQIKVLGLKHPDTLRTKHNLAVVFENQDKHDDAQVLYKEILQMQTEVLGPEHPNTLRTKRNLEKLENCPEATVLQ